MKRYRAITSTTGGAALRGGNWNNGVNAGAFTLNLNNSSGNSNTNIGFRCVYRPQIFERKMFMLRNFTFVGSTALGLLVIGPWTVLNLNFRKFFTKLRRSFVKNNFFRSFSGNFSFKHHFSGKFLGISGKIRKIFRKLEIVL